VLGSGAVIAELVDADTGWGEGKVLEGLGFDFLQIVELGEAGW
jgi:hypothetical protein